jgi:hypothetical protein
MGGPGGWSATPPFGGRAPLLALAAVLAAQSACSEPCCTYDSQPIPLARARNGEILAQVSIDGRAPASAVIDTGSPITLWSATGTEDVQRHEVRLLGLAAGAGNGTHTPTRGIFRRTTTVAATLGSLEGAGAPIQPVLVLGGDLLSNFSVELGFGAPELVLWPEQRAGDGFLSAVGYAVLHTKLRGGGELEALGPREGFGPRGPYQYPSSLLALRACGAPRAFDREAPLPARCCAGDERALASGVDLSLLVSTGVGPLVLSRSAWARVITQLDTAPARTPGTLLVTASISPIAAEWSTLPRLALVDRQADPSVDPGPCVELGRARRLEQIDVIQAGNADQAACALPCDQDSRGRAQDSAGYLELAGDLKVAIVADGEPILQTARAEIRPDGPEVDGILGAGVLIDARVELDYRSQPARAIFSCEASAAAGSCRTVGMCPRLPDAEQTHACFGLPSHGLPRICDNHTACE